MTPVKQADSSSDVEEKHDVLDSNEFMDDDFGLSSIRQEAEILRLQQLKVEQEIAALQRESQSQSKPPPPYQPPEPSSSRVPPPRPEKPPQIKPVVPTQREEVLEVIETYVKTIYQARQQGLELTTFTFQPDNVDVPEDLNDEERESYLSYHNMIFSVTLEKIINIYKWETVEQNPPWMQQLPLAKMRYTAPRTLEDLVAMVQREVGADLKVVKKIEKENLLVRWAGKKRDRVDEILVRELQEEETMWTNYAEDEVMVKYQMAEVLLEGLISDTARVFSDILKKINARMQ